MVLKMMDIPLHIKIKHRILAFFMLISLLIKHHWDEEKVLDEAIQRLHKSRIKLWLDEREDN